MAKCNSVIVDDIDGKRSDTNNKFYLDRLLAHEFTHAVMNANVRYATGSNGLPQFIKDGVAELTHGIDDCRKDSIEKYAMDSTSLEDALDTKRLFDNDEDIKLVQRGYAGGYMFMRYIAKQFSSYADRVEYADSVIEDENSLPKGLTRDGALLTAASTFKGNAIYLPDYSNVTKVNASALSKGVEITGSTLNDSVKGGKGADTIFGGMGNDSLWGGAKNDLLYGGSGNDKILGEAGNDTLYGGIGDDTLTGGDGNDLFSYEGGKDTITDYQAGKDKVEILSGSIKGASVSGTNVILETEDGSITLKDAKDKEITIINSEGIENTTIVSGIKSKTYSNTSTTDKVTLTSTYNVADATARTKAAIRIVGNAKDNSILGGSKNDTLYGADGNDYLVGNAGNDKLYGQNGNDTLWGGAGNDTLKGGDGKDLFIYSSGNDVITDYATGDKISLGAAISKSSVKGSDATFTIGKDTLKVKNGKGKEIVFIDAEGTERTIIGGAYLAIDSSSSNSTLAAWREVGDASARTKAIKLTGNKLNNSIFGGSGKDALYGADGNDYLAGGKGNDTLYGQNGNDTLWGSIGDDMLKGGKGADVFIYNSGEGKDVISDFGNDDMLQITGTFSATYNKSSKTIAFKVGSTASAITLKDFTATTFNVNGNAYKISGSKLVKK